MQIEPILELFENTTPIPNEFRVVVKIPNEENYEIDFVGAISEDSETKTFHVDVNIADYNDGDKELSIELGDLDASTINKYVRVHLIYEGETNSGEGIASTEAAQQESRPVTKDQLPD